jgi:hypothetical protein
MTRSDFTITMLVDQTPDEVYAAINDVRGWWTGAPGVEGSTDTLDDEFTYRYDPHHYSKQRVTALVPGKEVAWLVVEGRLNFVADKSEWTGTRIRFEIAQQGEKTHLRFTHGGLVPASECFNACSDAWSGYINGCLRNLITAGERLPLRDRR